MRRQSLSLAALALASLTAGSAAAQFFTNTLTTSFNATTGTVTLTPAVTTNQINYSIDVVGQFRVSNALGGTQTASFLLSCGLDPTFNAGVPLTMQLQITQSGFVSVPIFGLMTTWTMSTSSFDNANNLLSTVSATLPGVPFSPGITPYGPIVNVGAPFIYNPAIVGRMDVNFSSDFLPPSVPNDFIWDFPLTLQFVVVPEPTSIVAMAATAFLSISSVRRLRGRRS